MNASSSKQMARNREIPPRAKNSVPTKGFEMDVKSTPEETRKKQKEDIASLQSFRNSCGVHKARIECYRVQLITAGAKQIGDAFNGKALSFDECDKNITLFASKCKRITASRISRLLQGAAIGTASAVANAR